MKYSKCYFKEEAGEPVKPAFIVAEQFNLLSDHRIESKQHREQHSHQDKRAKSNAASLAAIKKAYIFKTYGLLISARGMLQACVHIWMLQAGGNTWLSVVYSNDSCAVIVYELICIYFNIFSPTQQ